MEQQSRLPGLIKIIHSLRKLADASLERGEFCRNCIACGWQMEPATYAGEENNYIAFHLNRVDRWFHLTLENSAMKCAVLPLLFWEDFDADFCEAKVHQRQRAKFDRNYARALRQTIEILDAPLRHWTETGDDQFQKAVWQGEHSLLVLQQDDYDIQYGFDINFLLQPHQGRLPKTIELLV